MVAKLVRKEEQQEELPERYADLKQGQAELARAFRRASEQFKYAVSSVNIDYAGPTNTEARRKAYQKPIADYKKAVQEALDVFARGMA